MQKDSKAIILKRPRIIVSIPVDGKKYSKVIRLKNVDRSRN